MREALLLSFLCTRPAMQVEALPNSKLGTQEYWNSIYDREIGNYDEMGDEGEVWCVDGILIEE